MEFQGTLKIQNNLKIVRLTQISELSTDQQLRQYGNGIKIDIKINEIDSKLEINACGFDKLILIRLPRPFFSKWY